MKYGPLAPEILKKLFKDVVSNGIIFGISDWVWSKQCCFIIYGKLVKLKDSWQVIYGRNKRKQKGQQNLDFGNLDTQICIGSESEIIHELKQTLPKDINSHWGTTTDEEAINKIIKRMNTIYNIM